MTEHRGPLRAARPVLAGAVVSGRERRTVGLRSRQHVMAVRRIAAAIDDVAFFAERGKSPFISDVDGNTEERSSTISVFNGPPPDVRSFASPAEEIEAVAAWLSRTTTEGVLPAEIGVFVRSRAELMCPRIDRSGRPPLGRAAGA